MYLLKRHISDIGDSITVYIYITNITKEHINVTHHVICQL